MTSTSSTSHLRLAGAELSCWGNLPLTPVTFNRLWAGLTISKVTPLVIPGACMGGLPLPRGGGILAFDKARGVAAGVGEGAGDQARANRRAGHRAADPPLLPARRRAATARRLTSPAIGPQGPGYPAPDVAGFVYVARSGGDFHSSAAGCRAAADPLTPAPVRAGSAGTPPGCCLSPPRSGWTAA